MFIMKSINLKWHFFIFLSPADENLLRSLPNEICSCSSLTIVSVRGNKLQKIPVDIGRLTQLRVLNIVNNFLSNLPVTILNLTQLSALWISDNQSQPLMPLQKEFHKETQSYYLTCYLLPQVYTSDSTPTNCASTSTAPESTYDYYAPSTCDSSQQNIHITALENLSLAAIKRKRNICFASDPPQEIAPNLRLMRSPTPYPKELRLMQAKFAANKSNMQQHHQLQRQSAQQESPINNLDMQNSTKLLNTSNGDCLPNMEPPLHKQQQQSSSNEFSTANHMYGMPPAMINITMNNMGNDVTLSNLSGSNVNAHNVQNMQNHQNTQNVSNNQNILSNVQNMSIIPNHQNATAMSMQSHQHLNQSFDYNNVPRQMTPNSYCDSYRSDSRIHTPTPHTNINNDIVQYDSMNPIPVRRLASGVTEDSVDYASSRSNDESIGLLSGELTQPYQSFRSAHGYNETHFTNGNELKSTTNSNLQYQNIPMEIETNHNDMYSDAMQVI